MTLDQITKFYKQLTNGGILGLFGGIASDGSNWTAQQTAVYGPLIAIDASLGEVVIVTVTNGVAFTISAPTNPPSAPYTQGLTIVVRNASGGAAGAGTFDAIYLTEFGGNTLPAIANGFSRTFGFRWNGAKWVETYATAADVAN